MRVHRATLDRYTMEGKEGWRWMVDTRSKEIGQMGWSPTLSGAVDDMKDAIMEHEKENTEKIEIEITIKDDNA